MKGENPIYLANGSYLSTKALSDQQRNQDSMRGVSMDAVVTDGKAATLEESKEGMLKALKELSEQPLKPRIVMITKKDWDRLVELEKMKEKK